MNNTLNDPETVAKRLRFETKYLRKRFPFRSAGAAADKRQDIREKSDQSLIATPPTTASHQNCESSKHEAKVGEGSDDTMLERFVLQRPVPVLAVEELLQEAAKSKARAEIGGPSEWSKKPARVNKRFVANSLLQTESQNKRKSSTSKIKE
ncbi:D-directed R polymerases I and III subunit RPAC2 isoform 2 [Daphnia sinensis]|uniref:D-directed R polymerases I and III subunit RPAC2 isoform 2 n=1 Tax=Daphnia sinensis TaxID=1820382 RepID=A0AAD5PWK9_9CRUS|nr:D-directed R polymerases I and III subunit RPAC2 isoform 2 [Daphnia sinensis]